MSKPDSQLPQKAYDDLNRRVIDLIEGRGSEISRRLTKEMLKTFPSITAIVSPDYQKRLEQILANDSKS